MKVLSIVFVLVLGLTSAVSAQKQRIGHIDAAKLMESLPERDSLASVLESEYRKKEKEFMDAQQEYQRKAQALNDSWESLSDANKQFKQQELQTMQAGLQQFQQNIQTELAQIETDLLLPLETKVKDAIKKVAKANGYTYIIDTSSNVALYFDETENVFNLVAKELGIAVQ